MADIGELVGYVKVLVEREVNIWLVEFVGRIGIDGLWVFMFNMIIFGGKLNMRDVVHTWNGTL